MIDKPGYILLGSVAILSFIGILVLASVSFIPSQEEGRDVFYFLYHQIIFGFLPGIFLALFFSKIKPSSLKKRVVLLLILNLIFMIMVFFPKIGSKDWGAARWVSFGFLSFQPSEFLKITFILYLASWLEKRKDVLNKRPPVKKKLKNASLVKRFKNLFFSNKKLNETFIAFFLIIFFVGVFLIAQPDVSTFGIISLTALIMYFLAGAPLLHVLLLISGGISGLLFLIKIAPYRMNRFLIFINPDLYPMGIGYHLRQSLIAVGSGGIKGLGFGLSRQRFGFLPETMSDSVFAVFAEELGFIGGVLLILLFVVFLVKGFEIANNCNDKFLRYTAFGIVSWITIQAFVNIGAMISLVPLTGIPLPFISYGGSAIISEFIGLGILLNISKRSKI